MALRLLQVGGDVNGRRQAGPGLLRVRGLRTWFSSGRHWLGPRQWVRAVDGVDLDLDRGEILGIVGESGSGKTTLGRSILRLVEPTSGSVRLDGVDVLKLPPRQLRRIRRRMQIIFQDPYAALSPRMQVFRIIAEPLRWHGRISRREARTTVEALLARAGLEPHFMHRYPHEMSGGQRQRIAIARAIGLAPDLLVADEPVSALDVSVQAQVLEILRDLQEKAGIAMLFISHDLAVVERIADRIVVVYRGKVVEEAPAHDLIRSPQHPYTRALLSAVPGLVSGKESSRIRLRRVESMPTAGRTTGCPFAARCPEVQDICCRQEPVLEARRPGSRVACHLC